jgi:hypothetical protein
LTEKPLKKLYPPLYFSPLSLLLADSHLLL